MEIYNSLTGKKEEFYPLKPNQVSIYVCGPTVYDNAHIGHARAAYIFELIRSYFEYQGYSVTLVKNITDVDDKIIARAKEELPEKEINSAVAEVAEKYTQSYYEDMGALGIRRANYAPRATEYIERMQQYIRRLIEKGFAYEQAGDVYFDVRKFAAYGALSHQDIDQIRSAVRIEKDEKKKDALDFALWKKAKVGEPAWMSPWGKGRPGWHIECSVMSSALLGDEFDIHGGGRDLIFPHHENEIAQSRCYSGAGFARIWIHNGLLTIAGQKMAKSLGNFVSVQDFLKEHPAPVLKLFFLSAHYRSPVDFNAERIQQAKEAYKRFAIFYSGAGKKLEQEKLSKKPESAKALAFKKQFLKAMDDDFNTPEALAALFELVSFANKLLASSAEKDRQTLQAAQEILLECGAIFGLDFSAVPEKDRLQTAEIETLISLREEARKERDFTRADEIRKMIEAQGVVLEDTKEGSLWRRKI
ncbi:MAG: cysteine--tRNA ligase [Candidatus Omnitrophota bacterium]